MTDEPLPGARDDPCHPDRREVGRLTITYTIEADGMMTTSYDPGADGLPLVVQLGLLRLAEDTAIATAMETDDA